MKVLPLLCCFAALFGVSAFAQHDYGLPGPPETETLDEVLVTGEFPGPGLWKVIKNTEASNRSTFAVLPISELLDPNGRLALLRAKGYVIEEPLQSD